VFLFEIRSIEFRVQPFGYKEPADSKKQLSEYSERSCQPIFFK